jgi:hypothetical protein
MTLGQKQRLFTKLLAQLINHAYILGYEISLGRGSVSPEANAADGGHRNSCHLYRLAQDLNLFRNGRYLTSTKSHEALGLYWESLHPLCRWGGRFNDGNHYSLEHKGVK